MNVTNELEAFRKANAACDAVVLVDISTEMVLSSASASRLPQEEYDAMAALARGVLSGDLPDAALYRGAEEAPAEAQDAILAGPFDTRLFFRAGAGRSEVLICRCSVNADLNSVFDQGRSLLDAIMAEA